MKHGLTVAVLVALALSGCVGTSAEGTGASTSTGHRLPGADVVVGNVPEEYDDYHAVVQCLYEWQHEYEDDVESVDAKFGCLNAEFEKGELAAPVNDDRTPRPWTQSDRRYQAWTTWYFPDGEVSTRDVMGWKIPHRTTDDDYDATVDHKAPLEHGAGKYTMQVELNKWTYGDTYLTGKPTYTPKDETFNVEFHVSEGLL